MSAKPTAKRAKLFKSGRSQAVRLPKEFRMPGTEVKISRDGRKVVLEPIEFDIDAWFAKLDSYGELSFTEDDIDQPPMPPDNPEEMFD